MPNVLDPRVRPERGTGGDERLARVELRRQIARLERRLAQLTAKGFPGDPLPMPARRPAAAVPRALDLGGLEAVRDDLAARLAEAEAALHRRRSVEAENRGLLEAMLADPASYKWVRIDRADVGERGCGAWHSRPRLGLIGMLMGWWRVRVSSGCPLSGRLAAADRWQPEVTSAHPLRGGPSPSPS